MKKKNRFDDADLKAVKKTMDLNDFKLFSSRKTLRDLCLPPVVLENQRGEISGVVIFFKSAFKKKKD